MGASDSTLAIRWERALPSIEAPTIEQWSEAFRKADPDNWNSMDEEDAKCDALYEFATAANQYRVGSMSIDLPDSTHGDSCSVDVYFLPGGTTVITTFATWERSCVPAMIYRGGEFDEMIELADELLYSDIGDFEFQSTEEEPDCDVHVDAYLYGYNDLREKWIAARARFERERQQG